MWRIRRGYNKYNNKKIVFEGQGFDSMLELGYYKYLLALKEAGMVKKIERQPKFVLLPKFKYDGVTYRSVKYTPDFKVTYADGHIEIIEIKGFKDTAYKIRLKLFLHKYMLGKKDVIFKEITQKDLRYIGA